MSKEKIIETVDKFLEEIKTKHPRTSTYINNRYPIFKRKLETVITEVMASSQSVEMESQVNIYYISFFNKQTWLRYHNSVLL